MARNLLSSDASEIGEDCDPQEVLNILHEQQEEIERARDTGDGGWRCICHKIQSCVLASVKQTVRVIEFSICFLLTI